MSDDISRLMPPNSIELNAYRYWVACKCIERWTDAATLVLCHLLQHSHPTLQARARDLSRRVQLARDPDFDFMSEEDDSA